MQKRNVLSSPRLSELKKERQRALLIKISVWVAASLAVFFLAVYLSRLKGMNINQINISGNKVVDSDLIKEEVQNDISGKYLWLFPKTNILIYPKGELTQTLTSKFSRLKDINLAIKDTTLEIIVSERSALYTWCGSEIRATGNDQCYFLDGSGYIFDQAPYFSGPVYFRFYGKDGINPDNPTGSYFSRDDFKNLISFKDALVAMGLRPVALYREDNGDEHIYLFGGATLLSSPQIIFKQGDDYQLVAENLQAALGTEPLMSKFKNKYSTLQYIDLRFGDKVYDKFQ